MKKDKEFIPNKHNFKIDSSSFDKTDFLDPSMSRLAASFENLRECPSCNLATLFGMAGGRDAICENCGYKDPCCYD